MKIIEPTLVVSKKRLLNNVMKMLRKAEISNVDLRPHFKTHQSLEIANIIRNEGISKITVSSVSMAKQFANDGWKDICIAFPVNILEIDEINILVQKLDNLYLLVESDETFSFLEDNLVENVNFWIKVDVGYGRTGIPFENDDLISKLAQRIENSKFTFSGLLTHAGHAYTAPSDEVKVAIYIDSVSKLKSLKRKFELDGYSDIKLSYGDTPSCSVVDDFSGLTEIRPGNFVFYDLQQLIIGSCSSEDISVVVACPIVAKHPKRKELVIYGGGVHFSKDFLTDDKGKHIYGYGLPIIELEKEWPMLDKEIILESISQEHGSVKVENVNQYNIGDLVYIVPAHSCMTANLLKNKIFVV